MSKFKIDILGEYNSKFKKHLDFEDNSRILFSGIFGIGKTTFINEFFKESEVLEYYECIHLFPVNYSVASNEDIFELIKYDIFFKLLGKNIDYEKIEFDLNLSLQHYLLNHFTDILLPFLKFIPQVGGSIYDTSKHLFDLKKKFDSFKNNLETNEKSEVINFINDFSKKKGTIYENDFYTELIIGLLEKLKGENNKKNTVLVIDDLDRIDPEHIFRLLNVFSSQIDVFGNGTNENKFGFDKVIFVCDIENIKSIYSHKYGVNTDFNGYIDKFYSKTIFSFDIKEIIYNSIDEVCKKINVIDQDVFFLASNFDSEKKHHFRYHLSIILYCIFRLNLINLRFLQKVVNRSFSPTTYKLNHSYFNYHLYLTQLYDILLFIFENNHSELIYALQKCKVYDEKEFFIDYNKYDFLSILDIENHEFRQRKKFDFITDDETEVSYEINSYPVRQNSRQILLDFRDINYDDSQDKISVMKHFDSMVKVFNKIETLKNRNH